MIPIIVTHWGQSQSKLTELEDHLRENFVPSWSYYFGFPGRGLKTRKLPNEHYHMDPDELRGKYIGQNITHWSLWAMLKNSGERHGEESWNIIEDDMRFIDGWSDIYHDVMEDIPHDWDIVFFGNCNTSDKGLEKVTDNIYKGAGLCLHWYMLNRKCLDILLETNKLCRARMDAQMWYESYPHLNVYSVLPTLATQHNTELHP
jgi:GR25 family glycosyltransferase involved in LPS biosynthesis